MIVNQKYLTSKWMKTEDYISQSPECSADSEMGEKRQLYLNYTNFKSKVQSMS